MGYDIFTHEHNAVKSQLTLPISSCGGLNDRSFSSSWAFIHLAGRTVWRGLGGAGGTMSLEESFERKKPCLSEFWSLCFKMWAHSFLSQVPLASLLSLPSWTICPLGSSTQIDPFFCKMPWSSRFVMEQKSNECPLVPYPLSLISSLFLARLSSISPRPNEFH